MRKTDALFIKEDERVVSSAKGGSCARGVRLRIVASRAKRERSLEIRFLAYSFFEF